MTETESNGNGALLEREERRLCAAEGAERRGRARADFDAKVRKLAKEGLRMQDICERMDTSHGRVARSLKRLRMKAVRYGYHLPNGTP